jgi:hypothetical protein
MNRYLTNGVCVDDDQATRVLNLRCTECDHTWTSDEGDDCPECGSEDARPAGNAGISCSHCGATCHGEAYCHRCGDRVHYDYDALSTSPMQPFADPGGNSALRAASARNPRIFPCPSCGEPDRLTPADRALGYQCNACADRAERGY